MKYTINYEGKSICEFHIDKNDLNSDVITEKYKPLKDYEILRELVKRYSELVISQNIVDINKNNKFLEINERIEALKLFVYNENGDKVNFRKVNLRDYSDELGEEGYELYLYR